MTLVKTILLVVVVTLASNCSTTKKDMNSDAAADSKTVENATEDAKMMENGFLKGTIVASTAEGDCPFVIQVADKETYFLDPINMDESYQKDGMKVWFTFSGLRMMNRCQKATPINIVEITSR